FLAEVTLVTDKEQRTPVEVVRNGLRAVIYGGGDKGTLDLSYSAANTDVQVDDRLVTSGIDRTYPPRLPVARVTRAERAAPSPTAKTPCPPTAGPDQHRRVLVLARETGLPAPPVEAEPKAAPSPKQKRGRPGKI